jgi:hypothetical protein
LDKRKQHHAPLEPSFQVRANGVADLPLSPPEATLATVLATGELVPFQALSMLQRTK